MRFPNKQFNWRTVLIVILIILIIVGFGIRIIQHNTTDQSIAYVEFTPMSQLRAYDSGEGANNYFMGIELQWDDMPGKQLVKIWIHAQAHFTYFSDNSFTNIVRSSLGIIPDQLLSFAWFTEPLIPALGESDTIDFVWDSYRGVQNFNFFYYTGSPITYEYDDTGYPDNYEVVNNWTRFGWISISEIYFDDGGELDVSFLTELRVANEIALEYYNGICDNGECVKVSEVRFRYDFEYYISSYLQPHIFKANSNFTIGGDADRIELVPVRSNTHFC